jgi:hypothetical protein
MAKHCPFCETKLVYRAIDADFDTITEKWWCPKCKELIEADEPGLRNRDTEKLAPDAGSTAHGGG